MKPRCTYFFAGLMLLAFSHPVLAQSGQIAPDYKGAVIGTAVGIGAAVGVGIYLAHRNHTSLTGCVQQANNGLSLATSGGKTYELVNLPSGLKAGERLSLRGHKGKAASGYSFTVDRVSHDFGACSS